MLKVEDITFTYTGQNKPALMNINLEVSPGRLVLLTGPSGSGKSTLLHCINGLAPMHYGGKLEGDIWIAGRETAGKTLWQISELTGTVFQNPNTQFFQLTVEDEIAFGLEYSGLDRQAIIKRINKAIEDVEIEPLRNRDIFTLSSGEKQKVALASIIAMDQPLLLMDEPTANLDIPSIHELKKLLAKLKDQGRTIIVSEHRLWYLRDLADQVIVINDGQLIHDGKPEVLYSSDFRDKIGLRIWDQPPKITDSEHNDFRKQAVLEVNRLSGGAGNRKDILCDVNLSFKAGECIALMGHNGVGKSMLSRLLTGLQKESKGIITINGAALKHRSRIGQIGCVTQQAEQQLFSDTVLGELLLKPKDTAIDAGIAADILKLYGLLTLKDRHPQTLSGGEKQRLAIAASIAMNNEIIILDEPTSGMDMKRMKMLAQEVRKLCSRGILVMIITHDIELVSLCCDKISWMENGTVVKTLNRMQYNEIFHELLQFIEQKGMTMKCMVVYSSKTGNTKMIAEAIHKALPQNAELYSVHNAPDPAEYDFIAVGGWVDKGVPDEATQNYMQKVRNKHVGIFMTLGAYPDSQHAAEAMQKARECLKDNTILGTFICQGKVEPELIEMMARMTKDKPDHPHAMNDERKARLVEAAKHPNDQDCQNAADTFTKMLKKFQGASNA